MATVADAKFAEVKQLTVDSANGAKKMADEGAAKARAMFDQASAQTTRVTQDMMKAGQDFAEFGRGNLDAINRSTQAYVAGLQEIGQHSMAAIQGLTDHAMQTVKSLSSVKSLKEAADLQAAFARAALDRALAEQAKLQDVLQKTTEAAMAPITARLGVAMDRASQPLAA